MEQPWSIIHAWAEAVLFRNIRDLTDDEKLQIARDYVRTTNLNIASFLRNKPHRPSDWNIYRKTSVCSGITSATGNLEEAIGSLTLRTIQAMRTNCKKPIVPYSESDRSLF